MSDLYNSIIGSIKTELNKPENKEIIYNNAISPLTRSIFEYFNPYIYIITLLFFLIFLMNVYLVYRSMNNF